MPKRYAGSGVCGAVEQDISSTSSQWDVLCHNACMHVHCNTKQPCTVYCHDLLHTMMQKLAAYIVYM